METPEEKLARLKLMGGGDPTWDLSDKDRAAIRYALDRIRDLESARAAIAVDDIIMGK